MYRSSYIFCFLLAFLSIVAVCNGAAVYKHEVADESDAVAATPAAEHPPEMSFMPVEEDSTDGDEYATEMPKSDTDSEDYSSHDHGNNNAETSQSSDDSTHDYGEDKPETSEAGMGSQVLSTHDHGSHGANLAEEDEPSVEGSDSHMPHDGEMHDTTTTTETDASMVDSDEPYTSPEAESGVCIAATMLSKFAAHELVFEKHILAHVLCDSAGSCATKGHIVNFKGKGMMMGSYCDIVGCRESIMEVNSPKYSRGLKVESKSQDMHFTAFAARYETRGEEAVLSTAVRMGL